MPFKSSQAAAIALTFGVFVVLGTWLTGSVDVPQHGTFRIPAVWERRDKPTIAAPKGWVKLDLEGRFSLYVPPGVYHHPLRGIDSYVGEIVGPNFALTFDYGFYSNDLSGFASVPGYREVRFSADGHPAFIRSTPGVNGATDIGVYVPQAHCGRLIVGIRCDWDALEIEGTAHSPGEAATIAAMFRTLQFPDIYERFGRPMAESN